MQEGKIRRGKNPAGSTWSSKPFDDYLLPLLFGPKSNLVSKQDSEIKMRKV